MSSFETNPRRAFAAACAIAIVVSFAGLGSHGLWTPDEPRDASIGLDMARGGDFVVPRLGGKPFLEKPPLYWWVEALAFRTAGSADAEVGLRGSDAVARLPSAIFGALSLLVAYALATRLAGPRAGVAAVAILATMVQFSEVTHLAIVDSALVLFVALAHLGFVLAHAPRERQERRLGIAAIAIALPLAFLSKGVVGPALAAGPPLVYLAATRQWRALARLAPAAALALPLSALLVVPWAVALYRQGGPDAVREVLVANTLGRLFGGDEAERVYGHSQPFWYYLANAPAALAPWTIALPALVIAWRRAPGDEGAEPRRMVGAIPLVGLLLLSLAAGKRPIYLVPLFPALAAAFGWWYATARADRPVAPGGARWLDRPTLLVLLGAAAAAPTLVFAAALVLRLHPPRAADFPELRAALGAPLLAGLGALALVWTGGLGLALRGHLANRTAPRPAVLLGALAGLMIFFQTAVKATIDPVKELHSLAAEIRRVIPDREVVVLFPDETIRGVLAYELGRTVRGLVEPEEIRAFLAGPAGRPVLYEAHRAKKLDGDMLSRLKTVVAGIGPVSRRYVIAVTAGKPAVP